MDYGMIGKIEKSKTSIRVYSYNEICRLLDEAGFEGCCGYGSTDLDPFEFGSKRLILRANKR